MRRWRIHVSGTVLARNAATGKNDPPILVKDRRATVGHQWFMAEKVTIGGPSMVKHVAGRVWIESDSPVWMDGARAGLDPDQPEPPE